MAETPRLTEVAWSGSKSCARWHLSRYAPALLAPRARVTCGIRTRLRCFTNSPIPETGNVTVRRGSWRSPPGNLTVDETRRQKPVSLRVFHPAVPTSCWLWPVQLRIVSVGSHYRRPVTRPPAGHCLWPMSFGPDALGVANFHGNSERTQGPQSRPLELHQVCARPLLYRQLPSPGHGRVGGPLFLPRPGT